MTININEALDRVKNSIYGKDIRQAIIDAVNTVYDDATKAGNTDMEVTQARGTYSTLLQRLNALDIKGKITQADLDISADGKKLKLINLADEVIQAIAGTASVNATVASLGVTSDKIAPAAVTEDKTNFLIDKGNIFNKDAEKKSGGYYDYQGNWLTNASYDSYWVKIKPNTQYATNSATYHLVFFDKDKNFVTGIQTATWTSPFTSPNNSNIAYLCMPVLLSGSITKDNLMITAGTTVPSTYVSYGFKLDSKITLSDSEKANFILPSDLIIQVTSRNLFDKTKVTSGKEVYSNGSFASEVNSMISDYIDVSGLSNIYISGLTVYAAGFPRYAYFYDANKVPIGTTYLSIAQSSAEGTFAVPANAKYFVFSVYQRKTGAEVINLDTIQVESGTAKTTYESFSTGISKIKGNTLSSPKDTDVIRPNDLGYGVIPPNIFDKSKVKTGFEVYQDGSIRSEANSMISDYIPVTGLSNIYISGLTPYEAGLSRYCYFYDVNKAPIGTSPVFISRSVSEGGFPVPANAAYFVFTIYQRKTSSEVNNLNTVQVENGIGKTAYAPYTIGVLSIKGASIGGKSPVSTAPAIAAPPTAGKKALIFGDSITETATVSDDGATYTEGTRSNWPAFSKVSLQLGEMWNYAKSGAAYKDRVGVLERQKITVQINTAIANNRPADIIIIAMGANDGNTDMGDYNTAMSKATLDLLDKTKLYEAMRWSYWTLRQQYPDAVCYCVLPIQRASAEPLMDQYAAIKQMAQRYNFIIIDGTFESGIVRDFEINGTSGRDLYDGLHPNTSGQKKMSRLIDSVILKTYKAIV